MKERDPKLLFEAADRLAKRRRCYPEMRRGPHEASTLDDRGEGRERLEGASMHYVARLPSP